MKNRDHYEQTYRERTPQSAELFEQATQYLPGGDTRSVTYHRPYPTFVDSAEGCRLHTVDGETLLDFLNNYTQTVIGHAPDDVVDDVCDRFRKGNGIAAPTPPIVDLGRRLVERIPSLDKVRFGNSGTEATMNAIRAAMAHTGNEAVLKVAGGYHGTHDTVEIAVSEEGREHGGIPTDVERRVLTVPFNDPEALTQRFADHGDDLACFIVEPVLGVGGMIPATADYLETARDLCTDHDVPLIFDEVMTFRLAEGGAQERYGVTPDLTALGKIVGGGLPVGAFGGREDLMQVFHPEDGDVSHSGTFNANPATMAGGIATLETLDADRIAQINHLGADLRERISSVAEDGPLPLTVTGDGSLLQLHLTDDSVRDSSTSTAGRDEMETLFLGLRTEGIFIAPRGMANLSTPMDESEIEAFVTALAKVVDA